VRGACGERAGRGASPSALYDRARHLISYFDSDLSDESFSQIGLRRAGRRARKRIHLAARADHHMTKLTQQIHPARWPPRWRRADRGEFSARSGLGVGRALVVPLARSAQALVRNRVEPSAFLRSSTHDPRCRSGTRSRRRRRAGFLTQRVTSHSAPQRQARHLSSPRAVSHRSGPGAPHE
jgi:hypothetical protein